MKFKQTMTAAALGLALVNPALAAVSPEEAAKLDGELTAFGAQRGASEDGVIPAWDGGMTEPPSTYDGGGKRPSPWPDEQPYLEITQDNMADYADQLSTGTVALLERFGAEGFKIKVWPTHRNFAGPDWYYENTKYNASHTKLVDDGLRLEDAKAGTPFPMPQNGMEVYWNHLLRWEGTHLEGEYQSVYKDRKGKSVLASVATVAQEWPHYNQDKDYGHSFEDYYMIRVDYSAPARRAGEKLLVIDPMDFTDGKGRRAWQYLKGQRRVRRAPAVSFDTPNPGTAGMSTYDDAFIANGSPERYDWKLVGKKEMYMPYNSYDMVYNVPGKESLLDHYINPDVNRWEKRRVWVIEGTLKDGERHVYQRKTMYVDEDTWAALAVELYDGQDKIWRVGYGYQAPSYDVPSGLSIMFGHYDLQSGVYYVNGHPADYKGFTYDRPQKSANYWSAQGLSAGGLR
jgi:hypothetical protein